MESILRENQVKRLEHLEYRQMRIKADNLSFWAVLTILILVLVIDCIRVIGG